MLIALILGASFFSQQLPEDPPILRKEASLTCADWAIVANHYISSGEQSAVDELLDRTSGKPTRFAISNEHACHLIRLLYVPKPGKALRRPLLGAWWMPDGSISDERWLEFPFAEQNGVWFLLVTGYFGAGGRERAKDYIKYCQTDGVFRSQPLQVPTSAQAKKSLEALLTSDRWDPWFHGKRWKSIADCFLRRQTEF